ncbi:MAG: glycosyltransferase family 4 protein, partial [Chloroflexota bacterium]
MSSSHKPHILLIHQAFASLDEPGGTRHHELARYLVSSGCAVSVIASPVSYLTGAAAAGKSRWVDKHVDDLGVIIYRAYTYSALHRSFPHRVISFLSFMISSFIIGLSIRNVDLVWGTSPPIFQGFTAWALARIKRAKFLFEVRDLWPAFAVAVGVLRNSKLIRATEVLEKFLYSHADQVMVNSPGFIEHVESKGASQAILIPNGVDTTMFDPDADAREIRVNNGWEDKFVVMYAGAHGLSNDLGVVLQVANEMRAVEKVVFVFVGDGKEKTNLQIQAEDLSLNNAYFLPSIPKVDMANMLAAADACLAILKPIKLYATVYPNKVFDYMAAGKPVILAIDGVIREVVEIAGAGLFVPPGNFLALSEAIQQIMSDRDQAKRMGM